MGTEQQKDGKPGWLKRVQEQSWEPELLISGLVLFALFQVPDLVNQLWQYLELNSSSFLARSSVADFIPVFIKLSVYFLIVGFITHIFLRSIWVAYAGLSYLFEDGINFSNLNLPARYTRHLKKNSYEVRIIKLEKICSGMFSLSFLFFMIILGLINVGLIILFCVYLTITLFPGFSTFEIFTVLYLLTGLLFLFDLLTLGVLRRIPYVRTLYYPFYRVGRIFMLATVYEDIYYGFISNNKKWKAALITTAFSILFFVSHIEVRNPGFFISNFDLEITTSDNELLYSGHYEDRAGSESLGLALIPSDIIRDNVLRVFVPHIIRNESEEFVADCRQRYPYTEMNDDEFDLACLNDLYQVAVNDSVYSVSALFQNNNDLNLKGMVYWLDISHLPRGPHTLTTSRQIVRSDSSFYTRQSNVEFYKEAPPIAD